MTDERYTELRKLVEGAPATWEALADSLTLTARAEMVLRLEQEVVHLARFTAYLDKRAGGGCGDQGHKDAIRAQNTVARQVRRAFGYSRTPDIHV